MKSKDYFSNLKSQAKFTNDAYDKFLEELPDFEVPDPIKALLEQHFMTAERASTDKELIRKAKAEFYNGMDANINELLDGLPALDKVTISNEKDTHRKLKMLNEFRIKALEDVKKTLPDADKMNQEQKRTIEDLTARLEAEKKTSAQVAKESDDKVKKMADDYKKKESDFQVRTSLLGKLSQIELAKEISDNPIRKQDAINSIMGRLLQNELSVDETGHIHVHDIVDGVPKPKFFPGTNDQVTIDKLLETLTDPYIKKSNGPDPQTKELEKTKKKLLEQPSGGMTLAQRRAVAAQGD